MKQNSGFLNDIIKLEVKDNFCICLLLCQQWIANRDWIIEKFFRNLLLLQNVSIFKKHMIQYYKSICRMNLLLIS
jgi:hypothetical protein